MDARPGAAGWAMAFIAGFLAVLLFHQPVLWLLGQAGITQAAAYSSRAVGPFAVPRFISAAFWGGVWGMALYFFARDWRAGGGYWLKALLFGAVFPTLVAWFVVAPLKGLPMAADGKFNGMLTGVCVNAAWGLGTALLLMLLLGLVRGRRGAAPV